MKTTLTFTLQHDGLFTHPMTPRRSPEKPTRQEVEAATLMFDAINVAVDGFLQSMEPYHEAYRAGWLQKLRGRI